MRRLTFLLALLLLAAPVFAEQQQQPPKPLRTNAQRAVLLAGTRNTRDLGGLPVQGGYFRDGRVFRSGALCFITDPDIDTLTRLGLNTVIDLRLDVEIQREGPDRLVQARNFKRSVRLPMGVSRGRGAEAYGVYLDENRQAIRGFFELLSSPNSLPLLFHCSAGKDRTGILTALLLESLGTPRSIILDDYMQSVRNSAGLEVHPEWLQVVFHAVDKAGGIGPFLESKGVSKAVQAAVRANLVRPVEQK